MTAAVVLAAGSGSRFHGAEPKLLAPFRGRPLVCWAVEAALAAGFPETIVVTGAVTLDSVLPPGVTLVDNPAWSDGQATSLQAAVATAGDHGHDVVVVGLGDQPLLTPEAWHRVGQATTLIAVAVYGGRRGHPVRLAREIWPLLPATGDAGARHLLAGRPELVGEVPCPGQPVDVDTVEDISTWS